MKMIQNFSALILITIFSVTSAFANVDSTTPQEHHKQVRAEILKYIDGMNANLGDDDFTARVSFIINTKQEVVVLYVESENQRIDDAIKDTLNYKRIKTKSKKTNQKYFIDLVFK